MSIYGKAPVAETVRLLNPRIRLWLVLVHMQRIGQKSPQNPISAGHHRTCAG